LTQLTGLAIEKEVINHTHFLPNRGMSAEINSVYKASEINLSQFSSVRSHLKSVQSSARTEMPVPLHCVYFTKWTNWSGL